MATYTKGTFSYPPEVVQAVLDGYGVKTARQLAIEHGLKSRHVVVGIWSRARTHGLQMKLPDKQPRPEPPRKLPPRIPLTPRRIIPEPDPLMLEIPDPHPTSKVGPRGVPLMKLKAHHCRWPLWNDREPATGFHCGQPRQGQQPYCLAHCKRAFPNFSPDVPPSRRRGPA